MKLSTLFESQGIVRNTDEALNILGLSRGYTEEQLKKAYRQAAFKHHKDAGGSDEQMSKVNDAYTILSTRINDQGYADYIRQTDQDIKESGIFKGGRGKFQTTQDWEEQTIKTKGQEYLNRIKAARKSGETYETGGEALNRMADDNGLLPIMRLVMKLLSIKEGDYQFIKPHFIRLNKPYDLEEINQKLNSAETEVVGQQNRYNGFTVDFPNYHPDEFNHCTFSVRYEAKDQTIIVLCVDSEAINSIAREVLRNKLV